MINCLFKLIAASRGFTCDCTAILFDVACQNYNNAFD